MIYKFYKIKNIICLKDNEKNITISNLICDTKNIENLSVNPTILLE